MANDQNVYSAGQFYPGFGKNTGIDLGNEVKTGTTLDASLISNLSIVDAQMAANTLTGASIAKNLIQRISVPLTAVQLKAMTTPIIVIPAPGVGLTLVLMSVLFTMARTATAYANGGAVVLQYTTGTVAAINTIAAAVLTTAGAATTNTFRDPIDAAAVANDSIEITNATAPFITGTGTASLDIVYRIV